MAAFAALLATSGCATLLEVSAPTGDNTAGWTAFAVAPSAPQLSGDGRYSVFEGPRSSGDTTLEAYRHDALTGATVRVSSDGTGAPVGGRGPAISRDGRYVAFLTQATLVAEDTNLQPQYGWTGADVYVRDMDTGTLSLVSLNPQGGPIATGGPVSMEPLILMSADARYVAFGTREFQGRTFSASFYVRDRQASGSTALGSAYGALAAMSGDGLHVAIDDYTACATICPELAGGRVLDWKAGTSFAVGCEAGALALDDTGTFVGAVQSDRNGCTGGIVRYDRGHPGVTRAFPLAVPSDSAPVWALTMSADGHRIAFASATGLLPGDTNGVSDVYVGDLITGDVQIASRTLLNGVADGRSVGPGLSADGRSVLFTTAATNLTDGDTDGHDDAVETRAFRPEIVDILGPDSIGRGEAGVLGILAHGVEPDAEIHVSGDGITLGPVSMVPGLGVEATIAVAPDATPGPRDIRVVNPGPYGATTGWCFGCLTVT